jgi:predicted histone-like DNA-binding protein
MALYMKKYQNKVHDSKMYGKWYWKSRSLKTIGTRQIAAEITKKNTVTTPDVMAVLYSLGEILNEKLTSGYSVKLDGIGTFRTTVCSAPAEEKDKLLANSEYVKAARVRFTPEMEHDMATGAVRNRMLAGITFANIDDYAYDPKSKPTPPEP